MKKRYIQAFILVCFFGSLLYAAPNRGLGDENQRNINDGVKTEYIVVSIEEAEILEVASIEPNETGYVGAGNDVEESEIYTIEQRRHDIEMLDTSNNMEWFKQYKQIQEEYSNWIDPDETIYDVFSENELDFLFRIVETEVRGNEYFDEKVNVCSVIFNRMCDEKYFFNVDTLTDVLTEKNQFSSYISGDYKKVTVTETTKLACEYAYQIEDATNGALWFDSTKGNSWAHRNRTYLFTDGVGHSYYN